MPDATSDKLHELVITMFGERAGAEGQSPTSAIGTLRAQPGVYVAIQKRPFRDFPGLSAHWANHFGEALLEEFIVDARELLLTRRKRDEWVGYHAEMVVLGAMISANCWDELGWDGVKDRIAANGGAVICANAPCCLHCGSALDDLGIDYKTPKGPPSLTGWWNPVNDLRADHGSDEFGRVIPHRDGRRR
jgi:hypothetical protein